MSQDVYRDSGFKVFFFSNDEARMHVHVVGNEGEAKFWLEPEFCYANSNLPVEALSILGRSVKANEDEIRKAWTKHFC
ncbi:hypothetical protein GCM10011607_28940 [Shewanella inventionis]|uniref:DUF4160 domain-containing protein n=1 Tax=Shewanella inventionis TaxID=1738770 RepID=A0ABQ1JEJ3_9GAMM|nr:DUF4160 domain-containing protein [Shewanella inventionis]GGB66523.1 hypothetical protein GCM10011607_28940 [Shewanella inventionis]